MGGGIEIGVKLNLGGVLADLDDLQTSAREKAAVSAINKVLAKGKTRMAREISQAYNVTSAFAKDRLNIQGARFVGGKAVITGKLDGSDKRRSANLIAFVEKFVTLAQAKKRAKAGDLSQLRFQIKRGGPAVMIPGAFVANKGRTVFIREGKSRLPIKALQTVGIPQMFNAKRINKVVVDLLESDFPATYESELKYYIDRFNTRRAAA